MEPPQESLRKNRQTIVGDPGVRPKKSSYAGLQNVGAKDKQIIGDLVKRRFSSRVQADLLTAPEDIPALPSLPEAYRDSNARQASISGPGDGGMPRKTRAPSGPNPYADQEQEQERDEPTMPVQQQAPVRTSGGGFDVETAFEDSIWKSPQFDGRKYVSEKLHSATEEQISEFGKRLVEQQEKLAVRKKAAMYSNYRAFLTVGSQISSMNTEMESLRRLLSDFHHATSALRSDAEAHLSSSGDSGSLPASRSMASLNSVSGSLRVPSGGQGNRNSVMLLEGMWAQELNSLFRHVEGAQKFLPAKPGRHLIKESGRWYQLNTATWKPMQPVHMFLLNDNLLVATKKRREQAGHAGPGTHGSSRGLVADQCWPLGDISLIDLTSRAKNTLSVNYGNYNFVYQAEKADAHAAILEGFRKAREELSRQRERPLSQTFSGSRGHSRQASRDSPSLSRSHSRNPSVDLLSQAQAIRDIEHVVSEVDLRIAYRQFPEVVDIIVQKSGTGAPPLLVEKLDERRANLKATLLLELSQDYLSRSEIEGLIRLLIRLDAADTARHTFLTQRATQLQRAVKQVDFQGDIQAYIAQVAIIYFQMIVATVEIFTSCFDAAPASSCIVEWARNQVDAYAVLFARQLYKVNRTSDTYRECVAITQRESARLKMVDLDYSFLLAYVFDDKSEA